MERAVVTPSGAQIVALTPAEIAEREAEEALPQPTPTSVTKLQLVRALRAADLKTSFDAALSAAPAETQEDWSLAVSIRRDDPLTATFAAALGQSEAQTDDLFRAAAAL